MLSGIVAVKTINVPVNVNLPKQLQNTHSETLCCCLQHSRHISIHKSHFHLDSPWTRTSAVNGCPTERLSEKQIT